MSGQQSPASENERCQYPNKHCPNRRTTKRDGGLHRFCAMHRDQANENQKRWLKAKQRRQQNQQTNETSVAHTTPSTASPEGFALDLDMDGIWTDSLKALEALETLFDNETDPSTTDALDQLIEDLLL